MNKISFRNQLKGGVATSILGTFAFFGLQGQAKAQSICTAITATSPDTFNCADDSVTPSATADGNYTDGASFVQGASGGFEISNSGSLDVSLSGAVAASTTTEAGLTSVVRLTSSDALTFTNNGSISGSSVGSLSSLFLHGESNVTANSGQVSADGWRATAVYSETMNGDNSLTGVATFVSGTWSRGLFTDAFNGNNVTNTGIVNAVGDFSRAVIARAMSAPEGCASDGTQSTTVNVTGDVSADYVAITTLTCGDSYVNVLAGNTVSVTGADSYAILTMATLSTVTQIDGDVSASSTGGRAFETRSGSSMTNVGSTGNLVGTFTGGDGNDSLTIANGGVWTSSASSDFGTGSDSFNNAGNMNVDAAQFSNLESFNNSGTMSIAGGSFQLSGATEFVNTGTIEVAAGNTTITSDAALFNNGIISLQNGQAGDVLTIANDYIAGASAALMLDETDMFIVNGTTTGTTQIFVSAPATIMSSAMLIGTIEAAGGTFVIGGDGTQSGVNVALGNESLSGLIELQMTTQGNGLYVVAAPNEVAFQPLAIAGVGRDLWHQSADIVLLNTVAQSAGEKAGSRKPVSVWGQLYATNDRSGKTDTRTVFSASRVIDNQIRTNRTGGQLGVDMEVGESGVAGITVGYERAAAEYRGTGGKMRADGLNVGAYASFGRTVGPYVEMLVKYDRSNGQLTNSAYDGRDGDPDLSSLGGRFEGGMRWQTGAQRIALGGQLSYVNTSVDSFSAEGIDFKFADSKSLRGSLAGRVDFGAGKIIPFIEARISHEFNANGNVTFSSGVEQDSIRAGGRETWAKFEGGFGGRAGSGPNLSAWVNVGDVKGLGIRAGWRL